MAITYPIQPQDRFTVLDTNTGQPLLNGQGAQMINVPWGSLDVTQMIEGLADNVKWLLEVREPTPDFDPWTQKLELNASYDVANETATYSFTITNLTQAEIDEITPPHYTTSAGVKLAVEEKDQNAFARFNTLIDLAQMQSTDIITIIDVYQKQHSISVADYKTEMVGYGNFCYNIFLNP